MACKSYPPFNEVEKEGVCVSNPPKSSNDYSILFVFGIGIVGIAGIVGLIYYATKKSNKK
jgi:hypothetical protein